MGRPRAKRSECAGKVVVVRAILGAATLGTGVFSSLLGAEAIVLPVTKFSGASRTHPTAHSSSSPQGRQDPSCSSTRARAVVTAGGWLKSRADRAGACTQSTLPFASEQ